MDSAITLFALLLSVNKVLTRSYNKLDSTPTSDNCLIVLHTPTSTPQSLQWAEPLTVLAFRETIPIASYSGVQQNTRVKFKANANNCNLFLVWVDVAAVPSRCAILLTSIIPLARSFATDNEWIIFVGLNGLKVCMESSILVEKHLEYLRLISLVRTNTYFLQLETRREVSVQAAAVEYEISEAYKFQLFCDSEWSCFVKLNLENQLQKFGSGKANFHMWDVLFIIRRSPAYNDDDLKAIASARLHNLRMGTGMNSDQAMGASFMKIALIMADKHNFTPVCFQHRQHGRPLPPFKRAPVSRRRSAVLTTSVIRVYRKDSTQMTCVSPMVRTFLYCQQQRKWVTKNSADALLFLNRLDNWTWLCIVVELVLICFILTKFFQVEGSILILVAPFLSQGLGIHTRKDSNLPSVLLIFWSIGSLFLSACYLGGFESLLVVPVPDGGIKTFKELADQDYRIVVKNRTRTYRMLMAHPEANAFSSLPHLWKLKEMADIVPNDEFRMHLHFIQNPKGALFDEKPLLQNFRPLIQGYFPERECFVGEENIYLYPRYWAFAHPHSLQLQGTFERILESGIYSVLNEIFQQQDMNIEMTVEKSYEAFFGLRPSTRNGDYSAHSALFSMENPQANVVFKGCCILLGVAALGFAFEVAFKALVEFLQVLRMSCLCFEIWFE